MTTLEDTLGWYESARQTARRLNRLAEKYWDALPWDTGLGRDNVLRYLEADRVAADAQAAASQLDDLAIVLMFSVFEGIVRTEVARQIESAASTLQHPVLKAAARDVAEAVDKRSLAQLLDWYSLGGHPDLAERVRQVRRRRNWAAHGRRGQEPERVSPGEAYERLSAFLALVSMSAASLPARDES